jgi:hypothetical protein
MYSPLISTDKVLMGYGFCISNNPYDSISLKLPNETTLYSITRARLAPEELVEKFRELVMGEKYLTEERGKRSLYKAYGVLLGALREKLERLGWYKDPCDTLGGRYAQMYFTSQRDLLLTSFNHILGLMNTLDISHKKRKKRKRAK